MPSAPIHATPIHVAGMLTLALIVGGCAAPAPYRDMVFPTANGFPSNPWLKGAIAVGQVSGREGTNPFSPAAVDPQAFKKALEDSLAMAGYLAPAGAYAPYTLRADLVSLDQSRFGYACGEVKSVVDYKLVGRGEIRDWTISASGSVKPTAGHEDCSASPAYNPIPPGPNQAVLEGLAGERESQSGPLDIATGRSIRENIGELLQRLRRL